MDIFLEAVFALIELAVLVYLVGAAFISVGIIIRKIIERRV